MKVVLIWFNQLDQYKKTKMIVKKSIRMKLKKIKKIKIKKGGMEKMGGDGVQLKGKKKRSFIVHINS